ncbi:MAG: hypothetical protein ACREYF_13480 [Gammaproteobacteria bacterium]
MESFGGVVYLFNPNQAVLHVKVMADGSYLNAWGAYTRITRGGNAAEDIDAIRFLMSSGNIDEGTFALYGIK